MVMAQILETHGFDLSKMFIVAEMATTQAICQSIKARIGISILSRRAVAEDIQRGSLVTVPLRGIQFQRPFHLIQREGRQLSPLCEAFLEHLRMESRTESSR
jgi:DNA-binding transcriptional LysR family regulator